MRFQQASLVYSIAYASKRHAMSHVLKHLQMQTGLALSSSLRLLLARDAWQTAATRM